MSLLMLTGSKDIKFVMLASMQVLLSFTHGKDNRSGDDCHLKDSSL